MEIGADSDDISAFRSLLAWKSAQHPLRGKYRLARSGRGH